MHAPRMHDEKAAPKGRLSCRAPAGRRSVASGCNDGYSVLLTSRVASFSRIRADLPERPRK